MNKSELVSAVAERSDISKQAAQASVDRLLQAITDTLSVGGTVTVTGFGKFYPRDRAARNSINPLNGQPLRIPAKKAPAFKPGAELKRAVNEQTTNEGNQ